MSKKVLFTFLFLIFMCQSCGLSNKEIENSDWKLSDIRQRNLLSPLPIHIDHISFNESKYYYLVEDTIYRNNRPYAIIIDRKKGMSTSIEILIMESQDTLRYVAK